MRRIALLAMMAVLLPAAAARAGEPPNQNDPCSEAGRNDCGTTGVGAYKDYRYGLRWFGDYRGAIKGVKGATFCIDLRYWYPGKDYGYEARSAAGGIKNKDGASVTAGDLRRMSYALFNDGRTRSKDQQAAVMLYVHELMGDGAAGEVAPGAVGVRGAYNRIAREAARFAGPYTVSISLSDDLVVGTEAQLELKVTAASGAAMPRTTVRLDDTGAAGLPSTVRTGADGTATVPFTPTSVQEDLRVTATAAGLAAPVPDLYVPTRGKAARNGQRLVAPASKDYADTARAEVDPVQVAVTTKATPDTIVAGGETTDAVTISGPGEDWRAQVEVRLFGPVRSSDALGCQGNPIAVTTYEARAGDTTTPPIRVEKPGLYAYQLVIPSSDGVVGTTTACPDPGEVVRVQAQPKVVTQVSQQVAQPGVELTDTVEVSGLAGESATVLAALHGPFGALDQIKCDGTPAWTGSLAVPGDGTYVTDPTRLDVPGYYTYVEALQASDFVQPFDTRCAEAAETTIVRGHPAIATKVSEAKVAPGVQLTDTAVVTGLGKLTAPVKVELWGPYPSEEAIDCAGEPFSVSEFTANGDGEYVTEPVTVDRAGYYTYREAIVGTDAYDGVQTECGEAAETSLAEAAPAITTRASSDAVKPGARLRDRVKVTGLGRTPAEVEVELYGPYASRAAIDCAGAPYATDSVTIDGDGTFRSPGVSVKEVGFYTFVERIKGSATVRGVETECGIEAETSLARPEILTGRGDRVKTVEVSAAGDDAPAKITAPGVSASVFPIGIDTGEGALGIKRNIAKVGWWRDGAAPGDSGATLLAGHVDSARRGAGAFYNLKSLDRGDTVRLTLESGRMKAYRVRDVYRTRKENLPARVFSKRGRERLVLVTCGGPFNEAKGSYRDNVVVSAVPR